MTVDTAARPFVYATLEQSGQAVIGHLEARCRAIKGEATWTPRRLQPDPEVDPWPCCACVSLDQLEDWARRTPAAEAQGWCRSAGHAAAEILPAELKSVPSAADTLYSGVHHPGNREDTTMSATLTAEKFATLKTLFADVIEAEVPGMVEFRRCLLDAYKARQLDGEAVDQAIVILGNIINPCNDDMPAPRYPALEKLGAVKAPAATPAKPTGPAFEKGMIITNAAGQIVRVYVSKTGNIYGKVRDEYGTWEYEKGAMKGARHLTADEARAIGISTERCVFCATPIETKESLAAGYGPDCAEKYGLPWGAK